MKTLERIDAMETVGQRVRVAGVAGAALAVCLLGTMPAAAQSAPVDQSDRTGVSRPPSDPILDDSMPVPHISAKPSPAVPMERHASPVAGAVGSTIPASSGETYGAYVPYRAPGSASDAAATPSAASAFDPDASIVTAATAGRDEPVRATATRNDADGGIVLHVAPPPPGALGEGTLVKARLTEMLSTESTLQGSKFTATLSAPVMREGQVIVPAGAVLEGRVTQVRSGSRMHGGAAIHLEPRTITLPDGSQYMVRAQVIDTGSWDKTKVDEEGTIGYRGDARRTAATFSLATGGGAAAGAMIGGVPGALIGAGVSAGAATVVWLKQDRQAVLPKDLELVFSLTEPMSVTPIGVANRAEAEKKIVHSGGE